ncbi:polysaccharide deacetylase family protein [Nodosilinea nodulosa]|uniref:polysaccharide deacetylase family protein n=1 Tax=Nodosilinea nodulosa TaxID=416001 RepID=UPI0002DDAC88|nr:polysaccharide deacetylase family protein [Nodosilinea nodulosa]
MVLTPKPRRKPIASLSLDLDNQWSYMKIHGDPGWEALPSYLDAVVPRALALLADFGLTITFFIVGQDAAQPKNHRAIRAIAAAGHEIGNHSFHHESWLHLYSEAEIEQELASAERAIEPLTGKKLRGFRGPGYSFSPAVLNVLARRGYRYDASTFPSILGPLARAYYFMTAKLSKAEREKRKALFGKVSDGFQPLNPYWWQMADTTLLEMPVTTMPIFKVPIHFSYILYISVFSRPLALLYFRTALLLCRLTRTQPSLLLHPLDFLGAEDVPELAFFPAMNLPSDHKLETLRGAIALLNRQFSVVPVGQHAELVAETRRLPHRPLAPTLAKAL